MLEAIGRLVRQRRARLEDNQVPQLEVFEGRVDALAIREVLDRAGPERAADDRRALQSRLRLRVEPVDARGDQRLKRVRDPGRSLLFAELGDRDHDLLEEERVALGFRQQRASGLRRELFVPAESVDQLLAVGSAERLELDRRRADAPSAPARAHVQQLRPGETDDEERSVAHPLGHMLDQLEERIFGPMDVLEDEDERLRLRHELRPLARRPRDLLLAALAVNGLEDAGGQADQLGNRLGGAALAELLDRDVDRVVVGDVRGALDHLGKRPVRDALAVGQAAALEDGGALERAEEFVREAALPHAGLPVDREEVRAPVTHRPRVGVLEQLELVVASDERRDGRPARAHARRR